VFYECQYAQKDAGLLDVCLSFRDAFQLLRKRIKWRCARSIKASQDMGEQQVRRDAGTRRSGFRQQRLALRAVTEANLQQSSPEEHGPPASQVVVGSIHCKVADPVEYSSGIVGAALLEELTRLTNPCRQQGLRYRRIHPIEFERPLEILRAFGEGLPFYAAFARQEEDLLVVGKAASHGIEKAVALALSLQFFIDRRQL
jgi:hypothetical protein